VTIRWRLGILALQLAVLMSATLKVTGSLLVTETWFMAGLLAVVINPQLLEPWYPKPQDVLANSLIALFLIWTAQKGAAAPGWVLLGVFVAIAGITALLALAIGAGRHGSGGAGVARASSAISRVASSALIYSGVFWLAAIDFRPDLARGFWTLAAAWAVIMLLGHVNWQIAWSTATGAPLPCTPEGMIGPSMLAISAVAVPPAGMAIRLRGGRGISADGIVLSRIRRTDDVWAQVYLADAGICEELVAQPALDIAPLPSTGASLAGIADVGSTDRSLRFVATCQLEIGQVVAVEQGSETVMYQLAFAEIEHSSVRGGAHLVVRARATKLGRYSATTHRVSRHKWVPTPGAAVRASVAKPSSQGILPPATWLKLGNILGTEVPVFLDLEAACQGHLVILGMTRMGKTTLALRLAQALAANRRVTILDQTGEYVGKHGLSPYDPSHDTLATGISVFEPPAGKVAADEAYKLLERLVKTAMTEYKAGTPRARVLLIDEAHQFIPEPAGLGFNAPGRDSAYKFGVLMMQVRKYGLTIALISQRTAVVGKSSLSQCENLIAFKNVDQTGLDYLEAVLGEGARLLLPSLEHGQALVFGPALSTDAPATLQIDL
jgi:Helicase HerA, central domain